MAGRKKKYSDDLNPEMKKLYDEGLSLYAVGKQLGVHPEIVKRRLEKMGVQVRNKSSAMRLYHQRKSEEESNA